jgi:glycosyltransferase involved in cell wall biosynthesis
MSRALRVLSVQHYPIFGGPHNEILQLEPRLNEAGIETVVAMTDEPGTAAARLRDAVELHTMPLGRFHLTRRPDTQLRTLAALAGDVARLRNAIRELRIDLVKVHGAHNPQGAIAARLEGVPVTWVLSSTRTPRLTRRPGMALVNRMADAVLVTGRSLLRFYPGASRLGARAFPYFPPVDVTAFPEPTAERRCAARQALGIEGDGPVVGTVANINPQKGIDLFVEVARRVHAQRPETRFVIVGASHDAYASRVREQAARAGLTPGALHFAGPRADIAAVLPAFDLKLITSVPDSEGAPTTAIEAMAAGVPVITTRIGAVGEVVQEGRTGCIVPPLDAPAMTTAVLDLLGDAGRRRAMGAAGRAHALAHFSVERCAAVHTAAYDHALANHGRRPHRRIVLGSRPSATPQITREDQR